MFEYSDDDDDGGGRLYAVELVSERAVSRCERGRQSQDSGRVPGVVRRQPALCGRRLGY